MSSTAHSADGQTTDDAFLGGRVRVLQPADGFRSGIDAVLLAAAIPAGTGDSVLDVGTGAGVAGLCLAARVPGVSVTGIEIQPGLCTLARANAFRNRLADAVTAVEADLRTPSRELASLGLHASSFDHVMANPPFYREGRARPARDPGKARSNMLGPGDLERWVRFMVSMARPGASVTVIHRADAMAELLGLFERRIGALRLLPIHPKQGEPAGRILLTGRTASRTPMSILPGLTLHRPDGAFTEAAEAILRGAAPLPLAGV